MATGDLLATTWFWPYLVPPRDSPERSSPSSRDSSKKRRCNSRHVNRGMWYSIVGWLVQWLFFGLRMADLIQASGIWGALQSSSFGLTGI